MKPLRRHLITTAMSLFISPSLYAAEGGSSHYTPGFYGDFGVALEPEPGLYLRNDLYFYHGDAGRQRFVDVGQIRSELELDMAMYMLTALKVTEHELFGAQYAMGAYLPVLAMDLSATVELGQNDRSFDDDGLFVSDLGLIPISLYWNCGNWHFNASEIVTVPIGQYDQDDDLNGGLNYWSFETTFSTTYLHPEKGTEFSFALGYIYNTENQDTNYQTGQELHLELMLNQYLSETFAIGLQGFVYQQITGDSGSGALLGDFKGEAAGIGPAVYWAGELGGCPLGVSARWIHEFGVDKRLEGDHFFLSATFSF
ncbi:transporter [Verrucomicrobiaceae bacterium N1E253]|uniref:Transporter n=1 Tax=Oceaniferula marina TaxID=2748318 RepID=A0A851GP16_9BACT|nr:transporter [Oceaniferula marina]NWK55884.1 transporter [Oceaniferula marina]